MSKESIGRPAHDRVIGVVGAGTMGAGIAHAAAAAGFAVETIDTSADLVKKAYAAIAERLDRRVEEGKLPRHERDAIVARLRVASGPESMRRAELIIEAVPEEMELKRRILQEYDAICSTSTVLASNTSALSIERLGEGLRHPQRFLGMHFFNPVPVMKLVELVHTPRSDPQTMVMGVSYANALGKTPIKVQDSPGFVVNRVARPFYLESLAMLEAGVADVATIDAAMKQVGRFPMGPFELLDLIGLDVNLAVTRAVHEGFGRPKRFAPSAIQAKLVEQGRLGRKTGRGFYDYSGHVPTPAYETVVRGDGGRPGPAFAAFAAAAGKPADRNTYLYARVMLALINEGALAAETITLPRSVDLGVKLGLSFPEGVLEFADHVGLDVILPLMQELHANDPAGRYEPAPLLLQHVEAGELGEKSAAGFLRHWL